jgi:hypothetical protein
MRWPASLAGKPYTPGIARPRSPPASRLRRPRARPLYPGYSPASPLTWRGPEVAPTHPPADLPGERLYAGYNPAADSLASQGHPRPGPRV